MNWAYLLQNKLSYCEKFTLGANVHYCNIKEEMTATSKTLQNIKGYQTCFTV